MRSSRLKIYEWIWGDFTAEARTAYLANVGPLLAGLCQPGSTVLDLCCGAGAVSFFLEARGTKVTGLDLCPQMIDGAKREAAASASTCFFLLADILEYDLGAQQYDLAVCLGNSLQDIPHPRLATLRDRLWGALNERGRFVLDFFDGVSALLQATHTPEETTQQNPELIARRFRRYDPSLCAYVEEYRNVTTGELCEYTSYIYAGPLIDTILAPWFILESRVQLTDGRFVGVYRKSVT